MNHYMLDLETLGNGRDGAIVTLGVVAFDPAQGKVADRDFYARVALEDPLLGRVEASNVLFWADQPSEAKLEALYAQPREPLQVALLGLSGWLQAWGVKLGEDGPWRLWAKPPEFDVRLLRDAHERVGLAFPFHYRATRDMRTLLEVAQSLGFERGDEKRVTVKHNALEDARWQAQVVCAVYQELRRHGQR